MKVGRKSLVVGMALAAMLLIFESPARGKSKKAAQSREYVAFDLRRVRFPHRKHEKIIRRLNAGCQTCHHRQKKNKPARACGACHARRKVSSKGKYARPGQKLTQKDIYHLLCWQCHKKMSQMGYKRPDGSSGEIPSRCHHCHLPKNGSRVSMAF